MRWASPLSKAVAIAWGLAVAGLSASVFGAPSAQAQSGLQLASPESAGFSSERLKRLDTAMQRVVDDKQYAGVVTLLARHGKVVHFSAVGQRDLAGGAPLEKDAIFRIFSMSKPVTAVAMMMLYEEGRWTPQDPLVKFIPQFANLKVYNGTDAAGKIQLEDPRHPPTMRELMTMTAGFGYGTEQTPVDRLYRDERDRHVFLESSLQAMIDRLAQAPLLYQPGSRWKYSLSVDIQGYLIEQLSGMTLPQFFKQKLFEPLKMPDTAFHTPPRKRDRFATLYRMSEGTLVPTDHSKYGFQFEHEPTLPIAGGGLVSTAADYFRFAQMLLNGGELDGVRILSAQTVQLMMSNHLPASLMAEFKGGGAQFNQPRPGLGYGYNGAVVTDPGQADLPMGKGSYFWDGAAGTWFWIDPAHDIVFVGMVQRLGWTAQDDVPGLPPNLHHLSTALTYQALIHPER